MDRFGQYLVEMRKDLSPETNSIYFYPKRAIFIYRDSPCPTNRVLDMINTGELIFVGICKHPGENMPKYCLPHA